MGGGDKCLLPLGGRPILGHVIARLRPQVEALILNANGDPTRFAGFGLPVVPDCVDEGQYAGPLAGILAGMRFAAHRGAAAVATVPSDTPFLPDNLIARLTMAGRLESIAVARSEGRIQPVIGLFPIGYGADLELFLKEGASRRVDAWLARHDVRHADFVEPCDGAPSPFLNINTQEDLDIARTFATRGQIA